MLHIPRFKQMHLCCINSRTSHIVKVSVCTAALRFCVFVVTAVHQLRAKTNKMSTKKAGNKKFEKQGVRVSSLLS